MDVDVVAGYNTCLFDWRYIHERVELVVPFHDRAKVQAYSRYLGLSTPPADQDLASSAMGDNPLCYPKTPGRVNFDLWLYLKRENISGLENLKLNTVSKHFLNDEKHDLEAKAMFKAYREGARGRGKVAAYCRQDCKLVLDLMEKVEALPSVWEMAKITCTAPEDILFRGQQLKVYTQLVLMALTCNYVVEAGSCLAASACSGRLAPLLVPCRTAATSTPPRRASTRAPPWWIPRRATTASPSLSTARSS
jgi:DNA polymerase delta subunit 1